jgi:NodT family efflux transporter outer membrane factor (OMF) lipoprotein
MLGRLRQVALRTVLAGSILLGGCTVLGPEYREPPATWLDDWQTDLYGQIAAEDGAAATELGSWWRRFNDPALDALIVAARQANPSLQIAGLRVLESRAQLGIAASTRYPQLQQISGAASGVHSRRRGGGLPSDDQSFASYQAGFSLGWELDFWGRFQRAIEGADAAFFASIANQRDAQVLLTAQVADLYFAHRTTEARIAIAGKNAAIQQRSLEITQRLHDRGQESELDLQQAKTQYLATLSTIPELERNRTRLRNALCLLLGRPPGEIAELVLGEAQLPAVAPVQLQGVPAQWLLLRPDVRAAAWRIAAQSPQIGIAESEAYPSISLLGSIGWSGDSLGTSPEFGTLAIGPALTWNVFDHGRIDNNVRVQDARLQQAIEQYGNTLLQAAQEIDDAAIGVIKTAEQQQILHESVVAAERSLELANTLYQEGYAGFQRVLDAQRAAFAQAERELVNQGAHVSAVVTLFKALGGGWEDTPVEALIASESRAAMRQRSDWGSLLDAPLPPVNASPQSTPDMITDE